MKRSDMARRIQEMLDGEFYDPKGYGYQILRVVEALGMLPPIEPGRTVHDLDLGVPEWEPEEGNTND